MPELSCTVRRVGDHESRTEEYEVAYAVGRATPRGLRIKYQAARAYEINAAIDARGGGRKTSPRLIPTSGPTDGTFQVLLGAMQSAK